MSEDQFTRYLISLKHEDLGTLARLRRACGERWPGPCPEQAQFPGAGPKLAVDFLSLTLACQYKSETIKSSGLPSTKKPGQRAHWPFKEEGNIGAAWAAYCKSRSAEDDPHAFYKRRQDALEKGNSPPNVPSIHERFRTLLDAELELDGTGELAYRLRGLVRMLVAEDIPIDVIQLAHDLRGWRAESRDVQERWAKAFYAPPFGNPSEDADGAGGDDASDDEPEAEDQEEEEDNAD